MGEDLGGQWGTVPANLRWGDDPCTNKALNKCKQWRRYLWGIGARAPSSFVNSVHSAAAASLTVKTSKITKEKHVLNFHLSREKHAKTHVCRLKQSREPKEISGRRGKNS